MTDPEPTLRDVRNLLLSMDRQLNERFDVREMRVASVNSRIAALGARIEGCGSRIWRNSTH